MEQTLRDKRLKLDMHRDRIQYQKVYFLMVGGVAVCVTSHSDNMNQWTCRHSMERFLFVLPAGVEIDWVPSESYITKKVRIYTFT